jgi:osmotically-inducible protein OsmY
MEYKMNKKLIVTIMLASLLPLGAYAGAADDLGNGISNVVGGVGNAVTDVGKGVGNGVSDIGNGVGDAFSSNGGNTNNSGVASDTAITTSVNKKIKELADNKQIASGYDLQVKTTKGAVVISGFVVNAADVSTIQFYVKGVNGVSDVSMVNVKVK